MLKQSAVVPGLHLSPFLPLASQISDNYANIQEKPETLMGNSIFEPAMNGDDEMRPIQEEEPDNQNNKSFESAQQV